MTRYRVLHRTRYRYDPAVTDGYTVAYLLPRPTPRQVVDEAEVHIEPAPDERAEHIDVFGNRALQFGIHRQHDALTVRAASAVDVEPPPDPSPGPSWEVAAAMVRQLHGADALSVRPLAASSPYVDLARDGAALQHLGAEAFPPGRPLVDGTRALGHTIRTTFAYDPAFTDVSTPLSTVLAARRGVCQDFAHLAAGCLRSQGLAARYVSGYLGTTDGSANGGGASHAWCSVWVPEQGWVDFDPTNDELPTRHHVTVAWGRDYGDVAPLRGVVIGPRATQQLEVQVDVEAV
jgi:transglutaminase-like putative cysteine protease